MWARVEDGEIKEVTDIDPAGRFHQSLQWVEVPSNAKSGDLFNGSVITSKPAQAISIVDRAAERLKLPNRNIAEEVEDIKILLGII